jgi:hypothetical protein
MAALNKLAIIISGATDEVDDEVTSVVKSEVNGVYFYLGMSDGQPMYKNMINQGFLQYDFESRWTACDQEDLNTFEEPLFCCLSIESGWGHPSLVTRWDPPNVKVNTMVCRKRELVR